MRITKEKVKGGSGFCWHCGRTLGDDAYRLSFGSFCRPTELCKFCVKELKDKAEKALAE